MCRLVWGVLELFFVPPGHSLAAHTKGASQTTQARAFLLCIKDGLFFLITVGVASWVLSVLFVAGAAFVALSAVGRESVFDEVVAGTVWAGQGDGNWHVVGILT